MRIILSLILKISLLISVNVKADDNQQHFDKFKQIFQLIEKEHVEEPEKKEMLDAALTGMITSLDPHSMYFTKDDFEEMMSRIEGQFGGVGIELIFINKIIKVISPIDDLPADKAGIKPGDLILAVDGEAVMDMRPPQTLKKIRGKKGEKVTLTILSEGDTKSREVELTRDIVKYHAIKHHMEDDIAYVRIVTFNENTYKEFIEAMHKIQKENKNLAGIILDVRNNPGGLLDQAVAISDYFIPHGKIVSAKNREGELLNIYHASAFTEKAPDLPVVVMVNHGSASASEIVAGALKDHNRAVILGQQTFGKGTIQSVNPLADGSAVSLTMGKYYTPNDISIQAKGITPDIIVNNAKVEYLKPLDDDKRYAEANLRKHIKNDDKAALKKKENNKKEQQKKDKAADKDSKKSKKDEKEFSDQYYKDYQYARAYDLLKSLIIAKKMDVRFSK